MDSYDNEILKEYFEVLSSSTQIHTHIVIGIPSPFLRGFPGESNVVHNSDFKGPNYCMHKIAGALSVPSSQLALQSRAGNESGRRCQRRLLPLVQKP